jgi:hypothetical protein
MAGVDADAVERGQSSNCLYFFSAWLRGGQLPRAKDDSAMQMQTARSACCGLFAWSLTMLREGRMR